MKATKTKGFVLKKRSLLEKDIVFTIFTEDEGKISSIAKGIKKITSRRAAHIQTGNLVELELFSRGDFYYLQNSRLISAFSQIRESSQKTNYLYVFFFILDRILPDRQQEPQMYTITQTFLVDLARNQHYAATEFTVHLTQFLMAAGYVQETKTLPELIQVVEEVIQEKVPVHGI